ncbi:hypothetical protein [Acrocarpospora catenulata]|uniref:hypothetical protein n=1 Tax=Acrocarpospora catenulata TaxID=2836182 RepID=UPI001BDB39DB|nr:hypothetical protein [Acrocarpospora catenulata]
MRSMHRAGLLLALPLLTACGAAGPPGTAGSPSPSSELAVYRELTACIRQHGAPNFPDPVVGADGKIEVNTDQEVPAAALTACKAIADRLPGQERAQYTAAELAQLRKLAQCFRDNGIPDWPDPNADGEFPLPKRLMDLGKRGWRDQMPACRQYFVGRGLAIVPASGAGG